MSLVRKVRSLHLDLKPIADNYAELRFFEDNPNQYKRRSLPLEQIADLLAQLSPEFAQLATRLTEFAHQYQFEQILNLIHTNFTT